MDSDRRKEIERRAYELWEEEGRPAGREHAHWQQAEREFDDASPNDGSGAFPSQQESTSFLTNDPDKPAKKKRAPAKPRSRKAPG